MLDRWNSQKENLSNNRNLVVNVSHTEGAQPAYPEFNPDVREQLTRDGFVRDSLAPFSLAQLKEAGLKMWLTPHWIVGPDRTTREQEVSRAGDVARHPDPSLLFLSGSFGLTVDQEDDLLAAANVRFERKYPGATLIKGSVADQLAVYRAHLARARRFFGSQDGFRFARTTTLVGSEVADLGGSDEIFGIYISAWPPQGMNQNLGVAPVIVPKA